MRHLIGVLLLSLAGLTTLSAMADSIPDNYDAVYQLSVNHFGIGETAVTLRAQGDGLYVYRSDTNPTGLAKLFRSDQVREYSRFKLHENGIRPLEYRFDHTGSKKERHAFLNFDWESMQVANTVEGHTWEMEIPDDALDKLVVQVAVMMDLSAGKKKLTYAIADGGKLKEYHFAIVGEEDIKVPAGTFRTVKIERLRKDYDRTTHLWCAPELGYLPVRIKQIENEDNITYLSELKSTTIDRQ